jgi:putative DNA primase/helicase
MPFHSLRLGHATFSGRPSHPRPTTPYQDPPSPLTPISDPHTNDPGPSEPASAAPIHPPAPAEPTAAPARQADLVYLADIDHRPIEWLWQDRLAAGTLAMLSGDPGSGKTWVALAIAAALSQGRVPATPDAKATHEPCTILYATTHNGGPELVRPRFASLNGDPARMVLLRGVLDPGSAQPASLSLRDTAMLQDALERTNARLLIIDPLHSYLWALDRHRANGPARAFDNLAQIAEKHRCCILLVRHLRKRGQGVASIELSAAVRTEFLAASSPDSPNNPSLVQLKSNLGRLAPSLGYTIDQTGAFFWTGPSKLTPQDVLTDRPVGAGLPMRRHAAEWLRQTLCDGRLSQGTVEAAAQRDGVCMITVRRAKCDLGILSTRDSVNSPWYWTLPQDQQPAKLTGHLSNLGGREK